MASPQIFEMINELQRDELDRMSVHRIDALAHRDGMRSTIASTLVRLGMTLDHAAGKRAACTGTSTHRARSDQRTAASWDTDPAMHW